MSFRLCLALLFVTTISFSQPAVKSVKAKSRYLIEQFDVLADNDTVRNGAYQRFFREGNILLEEGQYAANQRTGVWTFYNGKGNPELIYNYSTKAVLTNNRTGLDSMGLILLDGKMTGVQLTPPPVYLASQYQISGIIVRESRIPLNLLRAGQSDLSFQIAATVSPVGSTYRLITSSKDKEFLTNTQKLVALAFKDVKWISSQFQGQETTAVSLLPTVVLHGFATVRFN